MKLGRASFRNDTGQRAEIYVFPPNSHAAQVTVLNPRATSPALTGRLLNIDVTRGDTLYSYDLTGFLPDGLLVEDESPYRLTQVLDNDHRTLVLGIYDNEGQLVGEFAPAAQLMGVSLASATATGADEADSAPPLQPESFVDAADAPQTLRRASSFFAGQRLSGATARARLMSTVAEPSSPQTVFTSSDSGLVTIILTEQEMNPALEAQLATREARSA